MYKAVELVFLVALPAAAAALMSIGLAVHLAHRIAQRLQDRRRPRRPA